MKTLTTSLLLAATIIMFGCKSGNRTPRVTYENTCSGCGTVWISEVDEPINNCPNCPLSEEEFEKLKDSLRRTKIEPETP